MRTGGRRRRGSEDERPGGTMTRFRMSVTVLAVIQALFAGFTVLVGAFANGGDIRQRRLVVVLHPLGAAGVLVLVLRPRHDDDPRPRGTPDSERGRRPGPCAADGRGPRAGRLGAGAGLLSGSWCKTKYRVANWPAYNQALVRRGDVTVWLSSEAITAWTPRRSGRRGGQRRYSDLAIETALTLRFLYHLPLRQAEGFLRPPFGMTRLDLSTPVVLSV